MSYALSADATPVLPLVTEKKIHFLDLWHLDPWQSQVRLENRYGLNHIYASDSLSPSHILQRSGSNCCQSPEGFFITLSQCHFLFDPFSGIQ